MERHHGWEGQRLEQLHEAPEAGTIVDVRRAMDRHEQVLARVHALVTQHP
jgi:hypothetical protein